MARRTSTFRQSDVERAVKAARAAGLDIGMVEVAPDGTIRVKVGATSEDSPTAATPYDDWKARKNARSAQRT